MCVKSAGMLSFLIPAGNVIEWRSVTVRVCVWAMKLYQKNLCPEVLVSNMLNGFSCLDFFLFRPLPNQSLQVKFPIRDLWTLWTTEESWAPLFEKQTSSYLQSPAPQNTGVIHDSVSSGIFFFFFLFWFPFYKDTKFRHFPESLSAWRKLHYNPLLTLSIDCQQKAMSSKNRLELPSKLLSI